MTPARLALFGILLALGGCGLFRRAPPPPGASPHYMTGGAYQLGGTWYYPRELTQYEAAGLAAVLPDHGGLTANGEVFDQTALAAAHQTLQLPAILRVTNLENGRQVLVRVNDRGPASLGRVIGLTRRTATLLGASDGTKVRLQLEEAMSRTVADRLGGGPRVDVAAAPRATVQAESLAPPPGAAQSARVRSAPGVTRVAQDAPAGPAVPDRLPEQVVQGSPELGLVYLRASQFSRADYAQRQVAQLPGLSAEIERTRTGKTESFAVRAGPFASVAAADAALDQARRAGVIDSRLVVE